MMEETKREWWEPVVTDDKWVARIREDYPEDTAEMDDELVRERYADGMKYSTLWDNLGDAYEHFEALADAYTKQQATFGQAREALKECSVELKEYLDSCGDCDHSVGICVCGLKRLIEDVDGITAAMEAPQ